VTSSQASHQASAISVPHHSSSDPPEGVQTTQKSPQPSHVDSKEIDNPRLGRSSDVLIAPTDLWSAAFREAISTLEPTMDIAQITGKTVEQLFDNLGTTNKSIDENSAFRRGLAHLRSVKGPLQNLKLALDIADPLVSFEPAAATVVGVVKGAITVR
jgi:hypothetical protein